MNKILIVVCVLGLVLLSGCTDKPAVERCAEACSKIELDQPPSGDYFIKGIWNDNTGICTCKTFVESTPTFKVDISK
jgi:hypothetical protein